MYNDVFQTVFNSQEIHRERVFFFLGAKVKLYMIYKFLFFQIRLQKDTNDGWKHKME